MWTVTLSGENPDGALEPESCAKYSQGLYSAQTPTFQVYGPPNLSLPPELTATRIEEKLTQ
jgi:hypothetical protein